ncbi:hypothetical protein [Carboxylicivirga linearis]|uniref:Secretion system C-terminal sorting domain-containing protein n=1 Tax=Carboxylicivirga linearis TaxID=1628157 RepID=A0ABS5JT88_9BACT|nr:hypothetical protein [Carboxylicivirga linearis]MBS2098129.1 hypothetical protein [Carboxylicivirga linearis]
MKKNHLQFQTSYSLKSVFIVLAAFFVINASAQTDGDFRTSATGVFNWSDAANWEVYNTGAWGIASEYPGESLGTGDVQINDGAQVALDVSPANPIGSLTFADGTLISTTLSFSSGAALEISGSVVFQSPAADAGDQFLNIGDGSIICSEIIMADPGDNLFDTEITLSTGTLTVSGNITMTNGNRNAIRYTDAGFLNVGGDVAGGTFTRGTSTVNYNGVGDQIVRNFMYHNLTVSNGGTKTLNGNTNIYGLLTLGAILDIENRQLYFSNTASVAPETSYSSSAMINISNNGYIRRDGNESSDYEMTYPIGIGSDYTPMILTSVSGSDVSGRLYVRVYNTRHSLTVGSDNVLTRYWAITTSGLTLTSLDGSFNYADNDVLAPITESNLTTVGHFDGATWLQNESTTGYDHATNQISFSNIAQLEGEWTLGEASGCFDGLPTGTFTITDGSWNNTATWNTGIVPGQGGNEDVTVFHNVGDLNIGFTVNSLTVEETGQLDFDDDDVTINNDFVIKGSVNDDNSGGTVNVLGNLLIESTGSFNFQRCNLNVTGLTTVDGTVTDTDGNGTCTFNGVFTVSAGGTYTSNQNDFDFVGGIHNEGSFTNSSSFTVNQDLLITGSSEVQFTNDIYIADNVTLTNENTGGLSVIDQLDGLGANSILVNKALINHGDTYRIPMVTGQIDCGSFPNTFNYSRDGRQYINPTTYYNLIVSNNNDKELQGETTVLNDLTTSGTADFECQNHNLNIGGAILHTSSGLFDTGTNTVTYNGTSDQIINSSIAYDGNLAVDGSGIKSLNGTTSISSDINILGATLNVNGQTLTPGGNVTVSNGATLDINDNSTLELGDAAVLTNNGILKVVGTSGNRATITTSGSGGYIINQNDAAAEFHALYGVVDASGGITIADGTVDVTNNFSYTTFSNGTGSEYLNVTGLDPVGGLTSVQSAVFESGPTYNVTRTSGTETITFNQATGDLAGENFDNDNGNPGTLIEWTDPTSVFYSTGDVSAGITTSWARNQDGSGGNPSSVTDGSVTLIVQDGHTVTLDSNGDIDVKKLIVGEGGSAAYFNIGADATVQTLTIQELLEVKAQGELNVGSNASHILNLYGNLINNGTVDLQQSYTSVVNTHLYGNMEITGSAIPVFNDVVIEAGCNALTRVSIDVNRHVYLQSGAVFDDGGQDHTVEFNWINNGGTYNATGSLNFDGGTSVVASTGNSTTFNIVQFTGGGLTSVLESINVNGDFSVSNNTRLSVGDIIVTVNGDFDIESGSEYIQNANSTNFEGASAQTINFSGSTAFDDVTFSNGGANAKTINGSLNALGDVTINNGATVDGAGTHTISGDLRLDGTCNFSGSITMNGTNVYIESSNVTPATSTLGTAELIIDGRIFLRHTSGGVFNLNVQNNVTVQNNYLVLNDNTSLTGQIGNTLTLSPSTSLYVRGSDNFPGGFGTFDFDPTAWVRYDASIDQTVRGGFSYGNLQLRYNNSKTVDGSVTITGILNLSNEVTFNLGAFDHTFSGTDIQNGNSTMTGTGSFTIGGYDGDQYIRSTGTGYYALGDLILDQSGATQTRTQTFYSGVDVRLSGDLTITNTGGNQSIGHVVNLNDNNITGPAGTLSLGAYCELRTTNTDFGTNVISSFATSSANVNSSIYYSLNGAQQIASGITYGNLDLGGGDKTADGDLTVLGDFSQRSGTPVFYDAGGTHTISGDWNMASVNYYTSTSATGTIVFDGVDQDIDGYNFNNITVSNTGSANVIRSMYVFGNLTVDDGSVVDMADMNLNIGGNIQAIGAGVFSQTDGTTTFDGTGAQQIVLNATSQIGHLTIDKVLASAEVVSVLDELHISGNTNINANAGILDISGQNVYFGDNLYVRQNVDGSDNPVTNFVAANSTAYFNGSAAQSIRNFNENDLTFYNIIFSGADKTFEYSNPDVDHPASTNAIIENNFTISGATVNGYTFDFYVQGNWTNTGTFQHGNNRTVYFNGSADQTISASSFGSVKFEGSQNKILDGNITVSYDLTIDGTANLDANGNNITVGHDWDNQYSGTYTPNGGKVIFNSSYNSNIYTGTTTGSIAGKDFYAVDFNKSGRMDLQGDLVVATNLNINSDQIDTNTFDVYVGGNFVNKGTYNANNSASTLTLNGSGGTYIFDPNGTTFRELVINAPGSTYEQGSDFGIQSVDMSLTAGTLNVNENQIQVNNYGRAININGGTLNVNAGSTIQFTDDQYLNMTSGALLLIGETGKPVTLENTHTTANRLGNIVITGGTLHANYYRIQKGTLSILGTATIDVTNNLSNGTFTNGYSSDPYIYLATDFSDFAINDVIFNAGAQYNVSRPTGTKGVLTIQDASGGLAGEIYENDPDSNVDWTFPSGFFWDGGGDGTSWNDAINWDGNTVPGINNIVYLNHDQLAAAYDVVIQSGDATCRRLNIETQGGNPISVTVGSSRILTVQQHVSIATNTTLSQQDNTALINVGQNWTNLGTFNHGSSTVTFNATGGNYIIATGGTGAGKDFYNVTINSPSTEYTVDAPMSVLNDLTLTDGTFDLVSPNNDLNVGGNWYLDQANGAVFVPSTADVTFDGNNQSITNGTFYNVIIGGSGTKTFNSNIAIDNDILLNAGATLDAIENNVYVRGDWTNDGGTFTQTGFGNVIFDRTGGGQQIENGSGSTTFNNLIFSNSSSKSFNKDVDINGDVLINNGSGIVYFRTYTLNGLGTSNTFTNNATFQLEGTSNFPTGFETLDIASAGEVRYYSDGPQDIYSTEYYNLRMRSLSDGISSVKTALGDLIINGWLAIDGNLREAVLDMSVNDANITLTGNLSVTANSGITWGIGDATLTHVGGDWAIDADISSFNNLILAGTGDKNLRGSLTITGDLIVRSNVDLELYNSNDRTQFQLLTGTTTGSFTMETGARTLDSRPSLADDPVNGGPAIPEGFGTYDFNENSTYFLYSPNGVSQTLYTDNGIDYGNLYFRGTKDVTSDGVADLDVDGDWDIESSTYYDGGRDSYIAGSDIYLTDYVFSDNTRAVVLNGLRDQTIRDDIDNSLDVAQIVFSGTGTKTLGDGNDVVNIDGDLSIDGGVTVETARNITFNGSNWTNNGIYTQTGGALTFNGASDQTINPGAVNASNYFNNVIFDNASAKTFVTNGADINGDLTINAGTVDLGALEHYIYDEVTNILGGTLISANADIILDGGTQVINTPNFEVNNITCGAVGTPTKYLVSDWTINGDLVIDADARLNTRYSSIDYDIYIKGNWTNNGTFIDNASRVTFNGSLLFTDITSGGDDFYNVTFAPSSGVTYRLLSTDTRFANTVTIGSNANLNLNSQTLYLGRNYAAERTHTVNGTLTVNENARLIVNNYPSQSTLNIESGGTLNVIGSDNSNVATLTSENSDNRDKTQINVLSGANLGARYYVMEYLADAGINMELGSVLDAVNNLSDGTWLGMRDVAGARYLVLEANYSGGTISNVAFNYSAGVPVQGRHYNVQRINATVGNPVTFDNVTGSIGSYRFEEDDQTPSDVAGKLRWPAITETYWTGAVDVDWHKDGNWDNGVPTSSIDAIIPDVSSTTGNNPFVLSADAVCKSLIITDGRLRIENDYDLTANADVSISDGLLYINSSGSIINAGGDWLIDTNGNFTHGGGTVNFTSGTGSASISPGGSAFNNVTFNNGLTVFDISASSLLVDGNFTIQSGTVSPSTNNYVYTFNGDYSINGGTFSTSSASNGTIVLNADGDQLVTNAIFDNLRVAGTGNKLFNGSVVIKGSTEVFSNLSAQSGSDISFEGDVTIDASATFIDGDEHHIFTGTNWYGDGSYSGNGTITFANTSANQNLYGASFNNLVVSCTGRNFTLYGDVNISGDLTFETGINRADLQIYTFTGDGTGDFVVESGVSTYVYGNDNFPKSFAAYTMDPTSNTYYAGSSDQNIDGVQYGHLRLNNANTKTLTGDAVIQGNLYVYDATIDVSTNNYSITIGGNWYNNSGTPGQFICRNGEVIFNGSSNQGIYFGGSSTNVFYDLTINASADVMAYNNTSNDFIVQNDLTASSGIFDAEGRTIYVGGDLVASGSGSFRTSGTYYLNQPSGMANIGMNGSTIYNLTINSGATYTVLDEVNLNGSFNLLSGVFDGAGNTVNLGNGNVDVINIDGTYIVGPGGVLGLGNGSSLNVHSGGRIEVVGNSSSLAKVSNNTSGGRYSCTIEGEIAAEYYLFEYMANTGVYLTPTSTIDAIYHFSNGTFSNGSNTGQMLRVENTQNFTDLGGNRIENVSFPQNPGGSAINVAKYSAGSGNLEFYNSTGVFAGEAYENDPNNLIDWTGPVQLTWNGSVSTDWNTANNWTPSSGSPIVPTSANNVIIANATNQPILTIAGQQTGNLTINSGSEIRINTPEDLGAIDLDIDGDIQIDGTLRTISEADYITVGGNWVRESSGVVLLNGNVTFDGTGGAKIINNRGTDFYSLTIGGTTQYQLASNTAVKNDVVINSGATFDLSSSNYTLTVKGNWANNGTLLAQQRKVVFAATSGTKNIYGGTSAFYDVDINASGVIYTLTSDITINEELNILDGELDLGANKLTIGDGSGTDEINIYGTLYVNEGATLDMADQSSLIVNSGGLIELLGTDSGNRATLTSSTGGRYSFDVTSGASIKARYYQVDYTDADGLYMHPGANIDAVDNLSDGIFSNGYPSSGSYMTLLHEMGADETLRNLVFNAGPAYNVQRTAGTTIFHFEDASGDLGNYLYEKDEEATPSPSSGLLRWPFVQLYTWEGDVNNDWFEADNWFNSQLPVPTSDVTISASAPTQPIVSNSTLVQMNDLTIESGASLIVQEGSQVTVDGDMITNGGLTILNTADSPASFINNGSQTNDITVSWIYPSRRYWYIGHCISLPNISAYDALVSAGNAYFLYNYNGSWNDITGVGDGFSDPLQGYSFIVRDEGSTVSHTGILNVGDYSTNLISGWQLIANPYSSYYHLPTENVATGDFRNTTGSVYVRTGTDSENRSLATFNTLNGIFTPETFDGIVAPMQSFWVKRSNAGDVYMKQANRIHDPSKSPLKSKASTSSNNLLRITLDNGIATDEAVVALRSFGSFSYSKNDSEQRMESNNKVPYIYSMKDNNMAVINVLPETVEGNTVELGFTLPEIGDNSLKVSGLDNFDSNIAVYLEDMLTGDFIDLRSQNRYNFTTAEVNNNSRFVLHFKANQATNVENIKNINLFKVYGYKQNAIVEIDESILGEAMSYGEIRVYSMQGDQIHSTSFEGLKTTVELPDVHAVYIIELNVGKYRFNKKIVKTAL